MHRSLLFVLLGVVSLGAGAVAPVRATEAPKIFRAGADRSDITPELGTLIVGNTVPFPAKQVHDPLSVRTLVLDDGTTRLAIVVCDNVGIPQVVCDEAKRLVTEKTGLPAAQVLISATHSHSAGTARAHGESTTEELRDGVYRLPITLNRYQTFIARRIADSVQIAINRLEPARIGWGSGREPNQVFNRRWHVRDEANRRNPFGGVDQVRTNPAVGSPDLERPAGPTDPEVAFVSVVSKQGRPLALLANYSLHYVGGIPAGVISADYFGVFAQRIGELLGVSNDDPPFVGIMSNGTSGDINNIDFRRRGPPRAPYEKMRLVANAVAAEVYRAWQSVEHQDWVKLDARLTELPVKIRRPTPEMVARARTVLSGKDRPAAWHPREAAYAAWVLRLAEAPEQMQLPIQALRIGDLAIGATPVETFVEVGLEVKARTPFPRTFVISLANGYYGYMPTAAQRDLGGYEAWLGSNRLERETPDQIVDLLLRMFADLREASR